MPPLDASLFFDQPHQIVYRTDEQSAVNVMSLFDEEMICARDTR